MPIHFIKRFPATITTVFLCLFLILAQIGVILYEDVGFSLLLGDIFLVSFTTISTRWSEKHSHKLAFYLILAGVLLTPIVTSFFQENLELGIFSCSFVAAIVFLIISLVITAIYRSAHSESWYRLKYPAHVEQKGGKTQVTCFQCNSDDLKGEKFMNKTYSKRMYCGYCQTTLFFSHEAR